MATILIKYDGEETSIVTGAFPLDDETPISEPTSTDYVTNKAFIVPAGIFCIGLDTDEPHKPLWHRVQAIEGVPASATFLKTSA